MGVMTVLSEINPNDLGITLPHEHLLIDCLASWSQPSHIGESPVTIDALSLKKEFIDLQR